MAVVRGVVAVPTVTGGLVRRSRDVWLEGTSQSVYHPKGVVVANAGPEIASEFMYGFVK